MNIVRYDPWNVLRRFHDDINRVFGEVGFPEAGDTDESNVVTSGWLPAVDIREHDDRFVLTADIPGVDPKDIEITMERGVLTLKGERKLERKEDEEGYKRVERVHGTFYRRFSLPDAADAEQIAATGKNGVLEITIPKKEQEKPRRIPVAA